MNSYGKSFHALLAGDVICPVMYPELFNYIVEDDGMAVLNEAFEPLGLQVVMSSGRSFYLAYLDGTEQARHWISSTARSTQEEVARVQSFISFVLEVNDAGGALSRETLVRAAEISTAVDGSAALRDTLSTVAISLAVKNTSTDHARISGILNKMRDMGYLKLISKEREEYVVTGKIDLFYDIMEHFACHIGVVEEALQVEEQGSLF